ncbi:MAG TPA: choice-of-anchor D domain-containing protein [Edaphobacter sp.]|nr:choice-of-anchor D domain-containing protein [Edaphobacter sp.]
MTRHGSVHGGQQPVIGATLQLYAVGTTGDGSAATPLLSTATTSGADGSFDITGKYTCPTGASLVYIVATGGNPGLTPGTNNSALDMMSVLGRCDSLTASTFIVINEATTVAAVSALSPFMTSPSAVGSATADASALANAFALASAYVNTSTGTAPGLNVPAGTVVPEAKINTLANVVTSCVNSSGGTANDGSACGTLFTLTTASGQTPPTNIITALNNVASNPALNTAALFNLAPSAAPYQPTLTTAPADFSIQLLSTVGASSSGSGPVTLSPTTLNFYQTNVPQAITMTNSGLTPVVIQSINISPSNWSQTNDCSTVLQAQSICTINVQSTNSTLGTFSGTLTVVDDDTNDAQVVQLNTDNETLVGTIDFGSWSIGSSGTRFPLAGVLTGSVSGSNPGDFSFASDWQGPLPVPFTCQGLGGRSGPCNNLYFFFTPTTVGTRSALLTTNIGTYLLTGTGLKHGPYFSFDSGNYDFGSTTAGSQTPLPLVITSYGDAPVTLLPPVIGGTNASDFAVTSTCTVIPAATSGYLEPPAGHLYIQRAGARSTCTLNVTFTPSADGSRSATLTETDSVGLQQTVTLTGSGASSSPPTANPTSLSFGNVQAGMTASQSVTVTSANQAAVTAQISGSNNYTVQPATCAQGATTCTFNITFSPTAIGLISGTLSLSSQGSFTNTSVPLTGTGIGTPGTGSSGSITLSPASLTFYQTNVPQTVTMTNTGLTPVAIQNINIDANWSQTNNCGTALQAQSVCSINIQSTNSTLGTFNGTMTVVDDDTSDAQVVQLNSDNETLAGTIDYGSWPIGTTGPNPLPPQVQGGIHNLQDNSYLLTGNLTGPNPGDFTAYDWAAGMLSSPSFTCTDADGPTGCFLYILFTPSAVGTRSSLLVTNIGTYLLTGTGLPHGPSFSFDAGSYVFGTGAPGTSFTSLVTLTSTGDAQVTLLPPVIAGPDASDFTVTPCSKNVLQPVTSASVQGQGSGSQTVYHQGGGTRDSCTLTVTFTPSSTGTRTATLTQVDTLGFSQTVTLTGNTISNPPPVANPTSLSFGNVQIGQSTTQTVTVGSPNLSAITAQILGSTDYSVQPATCAQSATNSIFTITFAPSSTGAIAGTLSLASPGSLTNTVVTLTGSGISSAVSLSNTNLSFGSHNVGTSSIAQTITLTNTGASPLHISNVAITTALPGEFIATGSCSTTNVVAVGQTCTLSVSFAPQVAGTRTGTLQIFSDALTSPDTIQLSGVAQ